MMPLKVIMYFSGFLKTATYVSCNDLYVTVLRKYFKSYLVFFAIPLLKPTKQLV